MCNNHAQNYAQLIKQIQSEPKSTYPLAKKDLIPWSETPQLRAPSHQIQTPRIRIGLFPRNTTDHTAKPEFLGSWRKERRKEGESNPKIRSSTIKISPRPFSTSDPNPRGSASPQAPETPPIEPQNPIRREEGRGSIRSWRKGGRSKRE